jgi:sugar phosphate isomerase/epimerase
VFAIFAISKGKVWWVQVKSGVFLVLFNQQAFEQALDTAKAAGLQSVEIGTGAYPGTAHINAQDILNDEAAIRRIRDAVDSRGLTISALSCHGNPLHPDSGSQSPITTIS